MLGRLCCVGFVCYCFDDDVVVDDVVVEDDVVEDVVVDDVVVVVVVDLLLLLMIWEEKDCPEGCGWGMLIRLLWLCLLMLLMIMFLLY
jgi:hypothetical protein